MVTNIASWVVRLGGAVMIVLGLLFWSGNAFLLLNLHMSIGVLLALALWVLAGIYAAHRGANLGLVATGFLVGILVLAVGMMQTHLLPGSAHWIIQVVHLLLGLTLIGFGEMLAARIRRARTASPAVA
jgi:hypothetical protein